MMNLGELAIAHGSDKGPNLHDYCSVYERLFEPFRQETFNLLEIGVQAGGSVRMWLEYFPQARVIGVDIKRQDEVADPRYEFVQGDQGDPVFWQAFKERPCFKLIIDDGSHVAKHVLASFEALWPRLEPGGLYIVEDSCCWFFYTIWDQEGLGKAWLARLLSAVNLGGKYFHGNPGTVPPNQPLTALELEIQAIEFHKGLVVIRKRIGEPNLL